MAVLLILCHTITHISQFHLSYLFCLSKADEIIIATFISTDSEAEVHGLDAWELNQQKIAEFEAKYPETEDMWEDFHSADDEGRKYLKRKYGEPI